MEAKIKEAAELIKTLYNTPDGSVGGYGHIVFDDDNIETEHILYCIDEAEKGKYELDEETRIASISALKAFLTFSEDERILANEYYFEKLR